MARSRSRRASRRQSWSSGTLPRHVDIELHESPIQRLHQALTRRFALGVPVDFPARRVRLESKVFPVRPRGRTPSPAAASGRTLGFSAFRPSSSLGPLSVCSARQTRKEVLFAREVAGKSGSAPGPYKRTLLSKVSCR